MKLSLVLPIYKTLHESKGIIGLLREMTSNDVEWVVINNSPDQPARDFFEKTVGVGNLVYIEHENIGVLPSIKEGYEKSTGDVVVFIHNDVYIYEEDWDKRIVKTFEEMPDVGAIGLFGSEGVFTNGGRIQEVPAGRAAGWSNMLEAETHGMRMDSGVKYVSIFDGYFMAFRREVLDRFGGIDDRYVYHHLYDRDMALESLRHGFKNVVIDIPSHHASGMTANRPEYQEWITNKLRDEGVSLDENKGDLYTHDENTRIFEEKWKGVLPLYVNGDGTYRCEGDIHGLPYTGDSIVQYGVNNHSD